MNLDFYFAQPAWLWGLLLPWILLFIPQGQRQKRLQQRFKPYADPHLLPFLLSLPPTENTPKTRQPIDKTWLLLWSLGILAMAGLRWDYYEVELFQPSADVVLVFDLSHSMDATDVKPSRIARARQEVDDILKNSQGINIGLVAFASLAQVITPITEDFTSIDHLLPSLKSDLSRLQGSALLPALAKAQTLLQNRSAENSHNIILITDGEFSEASHDLYPVIRSLKQANIKLHILGMGTEKGSTLPSHDDKAQFLIHDGERVISQLQTQKLQQLAKKNGGLYQTADYLDHDSQRLLATIKANAPTIRNRENPGPGSSPRVWGIRTI